MRLNRKLLNDPEALKAAALTALALQGVKGTPALAERMTFVEFVKLVMPRFRWFRHNVEAASVLQRVADGELTRVLFFWPPRHGKTQQLSRLFTAYYLYLFPARWVGINSYGADLAHDLSFDSQANFSAGGGNVNPRKTMRQHWHTLAGGGMWAAGVGGPITGKGFHLGIIDDPLKNAEEANSETIRKKQKEWYQSTFYTRAEPVPDPLNPELPKDAAIVIIQTRWHEDDLSGWILAEEEAACREGEDGEPERWYIVNFQAIRDLDDEAKFPASCTVHPDWRLHGEPLCPERYPLTKLKRLLKRIGSYFFSALFQQKPAPAGGTILQKAWFHRLHISQIPRMERVIGAVDLAYTKKTTADFTVCGVMGQDITGRYYIFRPYRAQVESPDALRGIGARCLLGAQGQGVSMLGVEEVAAQTAYISNLREMGEMQGTAVIGVPADIDKISRARGWSPIAEQGLITLVEDDGVEWIETFLDEATKFPLGKWDDQVDMVGLCFATIRNMAGGGAPVGGGKTENAVSKNIGRAA